MTENDLNILTEYLRDIRAMKVLTRQEEEECVIRMRAGDEDAKRSLIYSNLKLVVNIAKSYLNANIELYDLIQEGNVGLVEAANDFITKTGTSFKSYADDCVRHQIIDAIRRKPKLQTITLNSRMPFNDNDYFADTVYDPNALDPSLEVEKRETESEIAGLIQLIPNGEPVYQVAKGYRTDELPDVSKSDYNESMKLLAHPSRLRLAKAIQEAINT